MKTCTCGIIKASFHQKDFIIVGNDLHRFGEPCEVIIKGEIGKEQPDPNAKQKEAFKAGKRIYCRCTIGKSCCSGEWVYEKNPTWQKHCEYRVEEWPDKFKEATKAGKVVEWHNGEKWLTIDEYNKEYEEEFKEWDYVCDESDYRIVEPEKVDPYAELKAAFEAGKSIRVKGNEHSIFGEPHWILEPDRYEIVERLSPSEIQSLITALNDSKRGDRVEDVVKKWSGTL